MDVDCDGDTLLVLAIRTGRPATWSAELLRPRRPALAELGLVDRAAEARRAHHAPFEAGTRIAQKVGEEGVETALASSPRTTRAAGEAADLLFHLLVPLYAGWDWRMWSAG